MEVKERRSHPKNEAMNDKPYIGRFAPSPTGAVHFGTLIAAVASYLQARTRQGQWLIRMEDVDAIRKVEGSDSDILRTLEHFGFEWDGNIVYQTQRTELYEEALERLSEHVFACTCSRKQLGTSQQFQKTGIYPGTCRTRNRIPKQEHAIRLLVPDTLITFDDAVMGEQGQNLKDECGDFVIKRRDGLFAYQLAVVVDDADQGVSEIVRGADLLDSTARQIHLQQRLSYPTPDYLHLPLALEKDGSKLSKQSQSMPVDKNKPGLALYNALTFLGQQPAAELQRQSVADIWLWAMENWSIDKIPRQHQVV